ncbi:MAG TPA: hypothetical protein PK797_06820 [Burkholderiaceae bacterium]|jgi:predicted small lipoprotein YifL|nr:hypothetical protein [Burkholderiaceae bacterium]
MNQRLLTLVLPALLLSLAACETRPPLPDGPRQNSSARQQENARQAQREMSNDVQRLKD